MIKKHLKKFKEITIMAKEVFRFFKNMEMARGFQRMAKFY
jgi:hypothetical protein